MLPLGTTVHVRCALPLKANIVQAGGLQKVFISVMKFKDPCSRILANTCHVYQLTWTRGESREGHAAGSNLGPT